MASTKSSSLGRSNPNSRSSELTDPMRRSFSGNPFAKPSLIPNPRSSFLPNTPANTPSDFRRRNSGGGREGAGGSFFGDLDDKENGKDQILKPSKVRSPVASSKNSKNFMSPTISASSKVTVSPRKKVLAERNEPARTSVSSTSDAKSPIIRKVTFAEPLQCSDLKPDEGVEPEKFEALSLHAAPNEEIHVASSLGSEELSGVVLDVPFNSKNDTESSFETVANEPDCVNLDPSFKLSPTHPPPPVSSTSTILAPLDADPLMTPYDPKTNYLSPRPQFLHYKPKPRSELCKKRELEDSFMSGSFSDTEVTEDTLSEGLQKESEEVSSNEIVEEETSPARTSLAEETIEATEVPKPRVSVRSKAIIALLLLLSVAFMSISVTNSPVIDHTVFQDFYEVYHLSDVSEFAKANFYRFSEFAKANFDQLARNFHTWLTKSQLSVSEMISNVRGVHNLGHLQYCNLTVLPEYDAVDQEAICGRGDMIMVKTPKVYLQALNVEESDTDSQIDADEDVGDVSAMHYNSVHEEVQQNLGVIPAVENDPDDAREPEEALEDQPTDAIESDQALQPAEVNEPNHSEVNVELNDQPSSDAKAAHIHSEVFKVGKLEAKQALEDNSYVNVDEYNNVDLKDQPGLESDVAEIHKEAYGDNDIELLEAEGKSISIEAATEDNEQRLETIRLPLGMVPYLLLCGGTVLIASAAFNWSRKSKIRSTRVTNSVEQPVFAKAYHVNSLPTPKEEQSYLDKPSLRNGPTEIDMHGESCPSEMSSIQRSSSYRHKVVKELNEVHSLEKKPKKRRESLASSSDYSMGSPSYGSFTTYEKIQIKNGHGDAETITPVRRSSRIRSQATSPL